MDWMDHSHCAGRDPAIFFEERHVRLARKICASCPVRLHCQDYAVTNREFKYGGVWGGLDSKQLRKLAKSRRLARKMK